MQIRLDERLEACAKLVRQGASVADIGSDHALLPCYLYLNGISNDIIAADINAKPLASARKTLVKYNAEEIKLVLSDGFKHLPLRDDVIIAGMGGENIVEILKNCAHKNENTRFILQPMTRHEELRFGLYRMGFEIIKEVYVFCKKKDYTIMQACFNGQKREISDIFAFIGKQENPLYIKKQLSRIKKLAKGETRYQELAEEIERLYGIEKD